MGNQTGLSASVPFPEFHGELEQFASLLGPDVPSELVRGEDFFQDGPELVLAPSPAFLDVGQYALQITDPGG